MYSYKYMGEKQLKTRDLGAEVTEFFKTADTIRLWRETGVSRVVYKAIVGKAFGSEQPVSVEQGVNLLYLRARVKHSEKKGPFPPPQEKV